MVTAQRRTENIQNVPIAIQAITGDTLAELKVATVDQFVKYLPSVSTATLGPGQGNLFMRGLSVGALGTQGQGSVGQWPTVAVYLDDQSTQIPGRNLDVYAADLERIEVLEGPQGTLFGAGAEAGVLRYITNKPKLGVTEGHGSAGYDTTAHGAESSSLEAALNFPLGDNLAVRVAIYNDSRGGYIDNVPSTFTRRGDDQGFALRTNGVVPLDSVVINNYDVAAPDINPVTYKGMRLGVKYQINEDWNLLFTQSYQDMNAAGVFYQLPNGSERQPLQPLEVTVFNTGLTHDKFNNTAWTVNGKLGQLGFVYTGARLTRDVFQIQDYTNYARGVYGSYYQCTGFSGASVDKCYTPSSVWHDTTHNENQSHEVRFSTPTDWKVTGIGGLFWEERKLNDDTEWLYKSVPECSVGGPASCFLYLDPSQAQKFQGASLNDPGRRNSHTGFFDDFKRDYKQAAAFLSADWHITDAQTLTAGTRYYNIKNEMLGGNMGSFYCKVYGTGETGPCTEALYGKGPVIAPYGTNLDKQDPHSDKATGFKSRVNLSWKFKDRALVYATWSGGYRPSGFNRGSACHLNSVVITAGVPGPGPNQWCVPAKYESDNLTNVELGWKTTLFDNRLQFNGAVYRETWKDVQTGIFAPQLGLGNLTVGLNGPSNEVNGIELSVIARPTRGLTVQGSMSYNKAKLITSPQLINNIAASPGYGQPITESWVGSAASGHVAQVVNVFGAPGDPLANSPKLQINARARYDWDGGEHQYYWQAGFAHAGSSFSSATVVNRYEMPAWTTWDVSAGVSKDHWSAEFVGSNLTDVNKSQFTSAAQFIVAEVPQRPRTLGVRIGYKL